MPNGYFDLTLGYPQWQGSGRPQHLMRGAEAVTAVCAGFAPPETISLETHEGDAGGVRYGSAITGEANIVGLTVTEFAPVDDDAARDGSAVIARLCAAATGN